MLVLSRRESDKVLFPSLGITVEVLRAQGNRVRLGIEAPQDVPILRHEVADLKGIEFAPGEKVSDRRLKNLIYAVRSRLDVAAVNLNQLHRIVEGSEDERIQKLIEDLFAELRLLEREANQLLEDSGVPVNESPQVLLVEDSAVERQLMEAYLDLNGFHVTTARDGRDALDYLSMHARPDVVLLDMVMPHIDGPDFVRQVRSDPKLRGLVIFALTALSQVDVDLPTGPDGVDQWYIKPVDPKVLVAEVATYLTNSPLLVA